jgi:hypothetical protein
MVKTLSKTKTSKAKGKVDNSEKTTKRPDYKSHPRSYRFDSEIMQTLNATLVRINKISPKKVQEARLVKALILLSKKLADEELLKAVREVW